MAETMVNWGVRHVFGMVGHSNLGLADAIRRRERGRRTSTYIGIRHEGAAAFAASAYGKLTGPPGGLPDDRRPGRHEPADRALGREGRSRAGAGADRPGRGRRCSGRAPSRRSISPRAFAPVAAWSQTVLPRPNHAELMTPGAARTRLSARDGRAPDLPRRRADDPGRRGRGVGARGPHGRDERDHAAGRMRSAAALELLAAAKRPVIIVGHGARDAMADVIALAERLGAPVITTFKAKGQIARRPPARLRRPRPQRHAGRELGDERGRPAARASAPRSPTTPASTRAIRSSRSTSTRCSSASSTRSRCRSGARSA